MEKSFLMILMCYLFFTSGKNLLAYEIEKPFMDLFSDFTGKNLHNSEKKKLNASQVLIDSMNSGVEENKENGPLILIIDSDLFVYTNKGEKLLTLPIRADRKSGFFEMTAISHIGPTLAYYAKAKENGSKLWRKGLRALLINVKSVQELNSQEEDNWIHRVEATSWEPFKSKIQNMVDYALNLTSHFIEDVFETNNFDVTKLEKDFYTISNDKFPVPFNNVMIGTFMLSALESLHSMHEAFKTLDLDWSKAKVLIKFIPGRNFTAGLSKENNWLVPVLQTLSNGSLQEDRILIAPYIEKTKDLGQEILSQENLNYYKDSVWGSIYARTKIAKSVFRFIPSIDFSEKKEELPGNYTVTNSDNIEDFILRLKFSLENPTEMLSNTVAFWMAGEYAAKKGILEDIDIPGLTSGFKNNLTEYPSINNDNKVLIQHQVLETSGAREITPFKINEDEYLAVPQLAYDNLDLPPNMNGGKDAHVLIFKKNSENKFELYQSLPGFHNEGAEFFQMNGESYLATCSVAVGSQPPYNNHSTQFLYKWDGTFFKQVQEFKAYASKAWSHFNLDGKDFLALANGVVLPNNKETNDTSSTLFQWDGENFEKFQSFDTSWAYKFTQFNIGDQKFLGLTDHLKTSQIYKWNGKTFVPFQSFDNEGGRAFYHFKVGSSHYIALANILAPSTIYLWNKGSFELVQTLDGIGGRNFLHFKHKNKDYLLKLVFITGTRQNPKTKQISPLYLFNNGVFEKVDGIVTSGAVSAAKFESKGKDYIAIANSLTEDILFKTNSVIYKLNENN